MRNWVFSAFAALLFAGQALAAGGPPPQQAAAPRLSPSYGVVLFPGEQIGRDAKLNATDSRTLTQSFWINGGTLNPLGKVSTLAWTSVVTSGVATGVGCEWSAGIAPFECLVLRDNSPCAPMQWNINNSAGTQGLDLVVCGAKLPFRQGQWNHIFVSLDSVSRLGVFYLNGVKLKSLTAQDIPAGIVWGLSSPGGFGIGSRNTTGTVSGWYADHYLSGESMICAHSGTALVFGGDSYSCKGLVGDVPPGLLARFIDPATKKARDLGAGCMGPTHATPIVCQRGNGLEMVGNAGTGGQFQLLDAGQQRTRSNLKLAPPAPYGPGMTEPTAASNPSHRATLKWINIDQAPAKECGGRCFVVRADGKPVQAGDFLILFTGLVSGGGAGFGTLSCPAGWTSAGSAVFNPRSGGSPFACYKWASEQDAAVSARWTVNWTVASPTYTSSWALLNFGQSVAGVDTAAIGGSAGPRGSSAGTDSAGRVTTRPNVSLLSYMLQTQNGNTITYPPPGSAVLWQAVQTCGFSAYMFTITIDHDLPVRSAVNRTFRFDPNGCARKTDWGDGLAIPLAPN